MPDETKDQGPSTTTSKPLDHGPLSRRKSSSRGTSLAAATAINAVDRTQVAQAQQQQPQQPAAPSGRKPNILVIMGDDIGQTNVSAYSFGRDGLQNAEHRSHRPRGHDVHRLLRRAELHGGPVGFITGQATLAHRPFQGRPARRRPRPSCRGHRPLPRRSSRSAMPPASSARTISATRTSSCRQCTDSTSSSAISITSTPRRSRRIPPIRRTRPSRRASGRAACCSCTRQRPRRSDRRSALRPRRQADHRGHRPA